MPVENVRISWYRTPLSREELLAFNERSDLKGLAMSLGTLALWGATGTATLWSAFAGYGLQVPFWLFLHGTVGSFNINAVHELSHGTVFRSRWLNELFVRVFGFIGLNDWVFFRASHARHHRYTLHKPHDGEVVLPIEWVTRKAFWTNAIWSPLEPYHTLRFTWRRARGHLAGEWGQRLFPESDPAARRQLQRWSMSVIIGHGIIIAGSLVAAAVTQTWGWLLVPHVVCFSRTYGGWLFFLCNNTQHVGLTDEVPDFRMCCRSVRLPAFISFLYWHMQYHVEHHMYAAVPCYNLARLRRRIADDLPEAKGLLAAWKEISAILVRQKSEPDYQYLPPLPSTAHPAELGPRPSPARAGA